MAQIVPRARQECRRLQATTLWRTTNAWLGEGTGEALLLRRALARDRILGNFAPPARAIAH